MSKPLLLGLDLGTTNAKAVVYDLDGAHVAEAAVSYPTYFPRAGWAEQHPGDWKKALAAAVRKVARAPGSNTRDLAGIAVSSHGPGLLLIDERGQPLIDASPTWQDERSGEQGRKLQERLGTIWPSLGPPLHNFPTRLLWAIENYPDIAKQARYAMGIKDFLVHWLTGEIATEPSSGPGALAWYEPVFAACGWSTDRLPPVVQSTSTVGHLRSELAHKLGLPAGIPVVIGHNDGASATLATGAIRTGEAIITLSTNGVLRLILDSALPPEVRLEHALFNWPYLDSLWIAGGQTKAGASTLSWFTDIISGARKKKPFERLLAEAAQSPPGSRGVVFLPYLMGRGSPQSDPMATGTFTGLTFAAGRGDMVRAVLEGTTFALRDIYDDFQQMGYSCRQIRLSGGGARSALWCQIIADVLAQPLTYYDNDSTLGAAIVCAVGLGLYRSFGEAVEAMVHPASLTKADDAHVGFYAGLYPTFKLMRDRLFNWKQPNDV